MLPVYAYFTEWGGNARHMHDSGAAAAVTHLIYSFGDIVDGKAVITDPHASHERRHPAAESVDGQDAPGGHFEQLRRLKKLHPHLKVVYSFGGWVLSPGFTQAAKNPELFADSAYDLLHDPRWADVFDGIDIDWEYPNATGIETDTSGPEAYPRLIKALRERFGSELVTSAIGAGAQDGGVLDSGGYGEAAPYIDAYLLMTYDFANGNDRVTLPHSPLRDYDGNPKAPASADTSVRKLLSLGVPASKIYLGLGLYGRGWSGVEEGAPGAEATGVATGDSDPGAASYRWLREHAAPTGTVGGAAYHYSNGDWWSFDTPETVGAKMAYVRENGLGGAFYWESSLDTEDAELTKAIRAGLDQ
ncbi:glycoside hydrolase family 18 protein [Salininema proteolyticum]|uniref:chitinase n=1 Tax=Salininema proteolyticum TaxID=1607685 RepID=A0ABV8TW27_9ACTN